MLCVSHQHACSVPPARPWDSPTRSSNALTRSRIVPTRFTVPINTLPDFGPAHSDALKPVPGLDQHASGLQSTRFRFSINTLPVPTKHALGIHAHASESHQHASWYQLHAPGSHQHAFGALKPAPGLDQHALGFHQHAPCLLSPRPWESSDAHEDLAGEPQGATNTLLDFTDTLPEVENPTPGLHQHASAFYLHALGSLPMSALQTVRTHRHHTNTLPGVTNTLLDPTDTLPEHSKPMPGLHKHAHPFHQHAHWFHQHALECTQPRARAGSTRSLVPSTRSLVPATRSQTH